MTDESIITLVTNLAGILCSTGVLFYRLDRVENDLVKIYGLLSQKASQIDFDGMKEKVIRLEVVANGVNKHSP